MAQSFVDALFVVAAPDEIVSIFLKGSSWKQWDSPIDYVPEISDIDIHVLFWDEPNPGRYYVSTEAGLRMQEALESGYRRRVPNPLHIPRVQFIPANILEREPLYVPSPTSTVDVLYGRPYQPSPVDVAASRAAARQLILQYRPFVMELGEHVADKPGPHVWDLLRQLTWRVAPAGPRALEVMGMPYEEAWAINRTTVVRHLEQRGRDDLATPYAAFYLHGWSYILSGRTDTGSARAMVSAAQAVFLAALRVAEDG